MASIIKIQDVAFEYQKDRPIFKDLSLEIESGECIGLVGSNGAGKSSLLKLLVGLNFLSSGEIHIDNQPLNDKSLKSIRNKIGYAFQDSDSQLFMTTVYEDVAFGPRNQGKTEAEVRSIVESSLSKVGGLALKDRVPYKLSGGEKRLVALATVLSMTPDIILLDEPTTGLDPRARRRLMNVLKELNQTKIIATHDMDMALDICDRIVVIHEGEIVDSGKPEQIFINKELLTRCHLEQPLRLQGCPLCSVRT